MLFWTSFFLSASLIWTLSPASNGFSTCSLQTLYELYLFELLLRSVVSSFGTIVLNIVMAMNDELMMMNCFCGIVDQRKRFSLIFDWGHCQRPSSLWMSDILQAGFNLCRTSPALVELSCAVVITTTSQLHCDDEPSCNGAACNISSVIWQSPPFGNIFCSALLKVSISFNKHIWFEISWNWSYD